jgi:hypothetical protein
LGTETCPWYTDGSLWLPLGYQAVLLAGTEVVPSVRDTTTVPPPPPETHSAWNVTFAPVNCTVSAGCEPGIVKSYPAFRVTPGLTLRSPSIAWGPMLTFGAGVGTGVGDGVGLGVIVPSIAPPRPAFRPVAGAAARTGGGHSDQ